MTEMPAAVHAQQLTKEYGDRPALAPLDLAIPSGQRVALIGHNGSGKTTLLKMLAGLLDVSGGTATIFGHAVGSLAARADVSWLSDTPTFYDDLSVNEHLEYTARLHGYDEWAPAGAALLQAVGLSERADDLPTTFSRGLRQKTAIALALIRPLRLLLVDEPIVGLDRLGKEALTRLLGNAARSGATLLVATHELSFIEQVDRVIALRDGAVVFDGPASEADAAALVANG